MLEGSEGAGPRCPYSGCHGYRQSGGFPGTLRYMRTATPGTYVWDTHLSDGMIELAAQGKTFCRREHSYDGEVLLNYVGVL